MPGYMIGYSWKNCQSVHSPFVATLFPLISDEKALRRDEWFAQGHRVGVLEMVLEASCLISELMLSHSGIHSCLSLGGLQNE